MKSFDVPIFYRSPVISRIKEVRKNQDAMKRDFTPTVLDCGPVRFYIARHFGFCFGVENAIEISYKAIKENTGRRIFLLSQMIHNPDVNNDLQQRGIRFIMDTEENLLMNWNELKKDDIVIIPAFGTTLEIEQKLRGTGIETITYNTTCPFVERVWKRAGKLGEDNYTVVIHGKPKHEETRATFSHSKVNAPSIVIKDIGEAKLLGSAIMGEFPSNEFFHLFKGRFSEGFIPKKHLQRIGVVNQTTMLASKTQEIANYLKGVMMKKYGKENGKEHFADTRDTLCYATNDNQEAVNALLNYNASFAIVVGGYNSSNTGHLAELFEKKLTTYYIASANEIQSKNAICHYDRRKKTMIVTENYLPTDKKPVDILIASGASCPDATVEEVLQKTLSFFRGARNIEEVLNEYEKVT